MKGRHADTLSGQPVCIIIFVVRTVLQNRLQSVESVGELLLKSSFIRDNRDRLSYKQIVFTLLLTVKIYIYVGLGAMRGCWLYTFVSQPVG